jgi:hypothetical protein
VFLKIEGNIRVHGCEEGDDAEMDVERRAVGWHFLPWEREVRLKEDCREVLYLKIPVAFSSLSLSKESFQLTLLST